VVSCDFYYLKDDFRFASNTEVGIKAGINHWKVRRKPLLRSMQLVNLTPT